jgi:ABC-type sugar transport system permease subunit
LPNTRLKPSRHSNCSDCTACIRYLGLPTLMKTPPDKALAYTVVVVIVAVAGSFILGLILSMAAFRGIGLHRAVSPRPYTI